MNLRIILPAHQIDRDRLPGQTVAVRCESPDGVRNLEVTARLRRSDGTTFELNPVAGTRTVFPFERRYRAGQYHIDVIARSKDGIEAWGTASLEITASRRIESVALDRDWGEVGDKISGRVKLSGSPVPGEKVRVQLLDARQRILVRADRPVADATAGFEFPIKDWMPMLVEVQALVMDGEEEVSSGYAYFRVTKRNRGRFNFVVWDWPHSTAPAPYAEEQLARLGCTVHLGGGAPPLTVAANGIAQVPYTTRILTNWTEDGYMKPTCWNDEPAVDDWVDSIVRRHEKSRQHGVFVYSLGDEGATKGCCVHPACLEAYRRYLEQQYGDIAALNESWGTNYNSFDEVNLLVKGDNDETEALRRGIYPRWYDRQAFKAYNFVKLCERFGKAFKEIDPEARTGFEGAGRFADGTDIDLICRTNGFWTPYPSLQDEVIRSIAPRDFIRSNWMGYQKDAESLLDNYWRMVTRGCDSVWWWRWDGLGDSYRGLLAPDLLPWAAIKEMQRDTQIVRDGLGTLLLKCRREDDGIAILYSFPSTFANKIASGPSYGQYEADHQAWHVILRSLGLQFSYVTDRMLRRGEFKASRYKVLILPQTEAIGPQEAEVIRSFAEKGGTVIADVRPGLYDGHCKPLDEGALDRLFGIERTGNEKAVAAQVQIQGALGNQSVDVSFNGATVDPMVRAAGGQPQGYAGTMPVCIVNQVGRGRAVLLNFRFPACTVQSEAYAFVGFSQVTTPPSSANLVAALLALAGVRPEVTVTDMAGNPVRDTEIIRWNGRGVDFLALFGGRDETVQVHLPHRQHIYDLREHTYRGLKATFKAHKMPHRATFIALSSQKLSAPQMHLSSTHIARGGQFTVELSYPESRAFHAARLRIYHVTLPIAYNDPIGLWTISAVDLYTDEKAEARVRVE